MTRRALLLFAATSVIWGSSFLFIRVAVEGMLPAAVVFGRTVFGAAFLAPLAARQVPSAVSAPCSGRSSSSPSWTWPPPPS